MYKRTNIEIDTVLLKEAMSLTDLKTIKEVVRYALEEVISMKKRKSLLKLKGKVKWEGDLDQMRSI